MGELNYCEICGKPNAQRHEIITRKTGGPREEWNTLWLCTDHHTLGPDAFHRIGRYSFAVRYPAVYQKIVAACQKMGRTFKKERIQ